MELLHTTTMAGFIVSMYNILGLILTIPDRIYKASRHPGLLQQCALEAAGVCQDWKDGNIKHSKVAAWVLVVVARTPLLMTLDKSLPSLGLSLLLYKMGVLYIAKNPFILRFWFSQKWDGRWDGPLRRIESPRNWNIMSIINGMLRHWRSKEYRHDCLNAASLIWKSLLEEVSLNVGLWKAEQICGISPPMQHVCAKKGTEVQVAGVQTGRGR